MTQPEPLHRRLRRTALGVRGAGVPLKTLLDAHGNAALATVMIVLAVPAMIPIPGVPVGMVMSFGLFAVALAMLFGAEKVPLPRRLAAVTFSRNVARHILHRLAWLYAWTARHARPRLAWLAGPTARRWLGVFVAAMAVLIFLPIPLGNIVPGAALVMLSLALIFADGLAVLISLALGGVAFGYLAALGTGAFWAWDKLFA
jgi:hypothetical protein